MVRGTDLRDKFDVVWEKLLHLVVCLNDISNPFLARSC